MKLAEISYPPFEDKTLAYVSLLTVLLQLVLMHLGGDFLNRLGEIIKAWRVCCYIKINLDMFLKIHSKTYIFTSYLNLLFLLDINYPKISHSVMRHNHNFFFLTQKLIHFICILTSLKVFSFEIKFYYY